MGFEDLFGLNDLLNVPADYSSAADVATNAGMNDLLNVPADYSPVTGDYTSAGLNDMLNVPAPYAAAGTGDVAKSTPGFFEGLLNNLTDKAKQNPLAAVGAIIAAMGTIKNLGQDSPGGQKAMAQLKDLMNTPNQYNNANTIQAAYKPTYHGSSQFVVTPPPSGALTQIKTRG